MRIESRLFREAGERPLPRLLVALSGRGRGRPRAEYRPRVASPRDVDLIRRRGVPAFLLTSERVTEAGYPVSFRPWLVLPAGLVGQVTTEYRILPVRDEDAVRDPGVEELITFLLRFDPLAARVVAVRHRAEIDPHELYRRVRNEGVERAATKVRLQEFARALPRVGEALPREELRWIEANNPAIGRAG